MTFAGGLIGIGVLLVLISALADPLGLGRHPGFGWIQGLGVVMRSSHPGGTLSAAAEGFAVGGPFRSRVLGACVHLQGESPSLR
jgi:hypothetical protein